MSRSLEYIFVGSVLGLLALMIGGAWIVDRARRRAWLALGQRLGFELRDRDAHEVAAALSALPLMNPRGCKLVIKNLLVGSWKSIEVRAFDVRRSTNPGTKLVRHSVHTAVALRCPGARIPGFATRPRFPGTAWLSRVSDHEEIAIADSRFMLFGDDERTVKAVVAPAVIAALEADPALATTCVEGRGEWLLVYSARGREAVEDVEARLREAVRIVEALVTATPNVA